MASIGRVGKYPTKKGERWYFAAYLPGVDPKTGKRRQHWRRGLATKREALEKLREYTGQVDRDEIVEASKITVGEYLDGWVAGLGVDRRPSTVASYRGRI